MNPLVASLANQALELKLRYLMRLDPFWQEKLARLNGIRLKVILTDLGFKRVFQFGPTDLHLLPPFTGADVGVTTRSPHLTKLLSSDLRQQAVDEGHIQLVGDQDQLADMLDVLAAWQFDWEGLLAQVIPGAVAHPAAEMVRLTQHGLGQLKDSVQESYRFWRDNEYHQRESPAQR